MAVLLVGRRWRRRPARPRSTCWRAAAARDGGGDRRWSRRARISPSAPGCAAGSRPPRRLELRRDRSHEPFRARATCCRVSSACGAPGSSCSRRRAAAESARGSSSTSARSSTWPSGCGSRGGAALGDVFSFLSGLYFRGQADLRARVRGAAARRAGRSRHHAERGLLPAEEPVTLARLRALRARADRRGRAALPAARWTATRATLADAIPPDTEVVLLGSIATGKYVDILADGLRRAAAFPGRLRRPRRHEPRRAAPALRARRPRARVPPDRGRRRATARGRRSSPACRGSANWGRSARCARKTAASNGGKPSGEDRPEPRSRQEPRRRRRAAGDAGPPSARCAKPVRRPGGGARARARAVVEIPRDVDDAEVAVGRPDRQADEPSASSSGRSSASRRAICCSTTRASRRALLPHLQDRAMVMKRYPHGAARRVLLHEARARRRGPTGSRSARSSTPRATSSTSR